MKKKMIRKSLITAGIIIVMTAGVSAQESVEAETSETELASEDLTSVEEHYVDAGGAVVEDGEGGYIETVTINGQGQIISRWYKDTGGQEVILPDKGYAGVTYEYDESGLVSAERYFGPDGARITLDDGTSGYTAANLNEYVKLEQLWLDENDEPVVNATTGYAHVIREADSNGNVIRVSFYDENEQLLLQEAGYAVVVREYDDNNKKSKESYLDENGDLTILPGTGYAAVTYEYDDQGLVSAERYYGPDEERILLENGISGFTAVNLNKSTKLEQHYLGVNDEPVFNEDTGYASIIREADENGNITRVTFYDEYGKLVRQKPGYAVVIREYDEKNQKIKESYLGEDGEPTRLAKGGYAAVAYEYDEAGNTTKESHFDEAGEPLAVGGYASVEREYDDKGQVVYEAYFNREGETCVLYNLAYASVRFEYDEEGNITRESYYGKDGEPTVCTKGYASITREYNEYKDVIRESYFDREGNPSILPGAGYASITREYDWMGLVCEERYFGKDGNRITLSNGASGYSVINLNKETKLEEMWLDDNDDPVINKRTGYAYVVRNVDEAGRIVYIAYYDQNLDPMKVSDGYAVIQRDYDENGKLIMESYFDENGKLTILPGAGYAAITYEYDEQGLVSAERYFGTDGLRTTLANGVSGYRRVNLGRDLALEEVWLAPDESPAMNKQLGYAHITRTLDDRGCVASEAYFDENDDPVTIEAGYASIAWEYDQKFRISRESYFDKEGEPMLLPGAGYASVTYEYDRNDLVDCERYYGTNGARITLENGVSGCRYVNLNKSVKLEESWINESDNLVVNRDTGYAHVVREANAEGLVFFVAFYDEEDEPVKVKEGYAAVGREFDENGKKTRESYFDEDHELMILPSKGYASITYEYDIQGLVSCERYYGEDGRRIALGSGISGFIAVNYDKDTKLEEHFIGVRDFPVINRKYGYASVVRETDDTGNIISEAYFDEDDHPVTVKEGYASLTREFDNQHQKTKESYFGRTGQPILLPGAGYASVTYTYDNQGIVNGERYYGTDGRRITLLGGVSGYDCVNLDDGTHLDEQWLDEDDEPAFNRNLGYAHVVRDINEQGNISRISFYDEKEQLVAQDGGYAFVTREYDGAGRKTRESYYDASSFPVLLDGSGYASIAYEYDAQGLVSCERYYGTGGDRITLENGVSGYQALNLNKDVKLDELWLDENDQPVMNTADGYAHIVRAIDAVGNVTRISYYDENYEPVTLKDGYSIIEMKYNNRRQKIRESYFDENGEAVVAPGLGYASVSYEYDRKGRVTAERYFWANGRRITLDNGVSGWTATYLESGVKGEETWIDRNEQPVINRDLGYATVRREADGMGDVVRISYYDEYDEPVMTPDGYAVIEREYNTLLQKIGETYLDVNGKEVVASSTGYASVRYEYDDIGMVSRERYFGADGSRIALENGVSGYNAVYLNKSIKTDEQWLDVDDKLMVNGKTGYAHVVREVDKAGNIIKVSFYDAEEDPVMAGGFASVTREYDRNGNMCLESYYDTDGEPIALADGYCAVGFTYDSAGNKLTERYYDMHGRLVMNARGYAGIDRSFDKYGNVIREAFIDEDGELHANGIGFAVVTRLFDRKGNKLEEAYFNADGYPFYPADRGYARVRYVYDNAGNITSARYFGRKNDRRDLGGYSGYDAAWVNGKRVMEAFVDENDDLSVNEEKGFALVYHDYDEDGNEIATRYYDEKRLPIEVGGAAQILRIFDENGNVTAEKRYNADGELIINAAGWAWIEKTYDDQGHAATETYINADGDPMTIGGYATVQRGFDADGNTIRAAYFDLEGNAVLLPKGYAALARQDSDDGKIVKTEYLGLNGEPVTTTEGYSMTISEYDENGNLLFEKWYDTEGNQINRKDKPYATAVRSYNEQGKAVRTVLVDVNNEPVDNADGYATTVNDYDEEGNVIYEAYFTKEGFQVMPAGKYYHAWRKEYDDGGHVISEAYFGFYNDPIMLDAGYAKVVYTYNDEGKESWKAYLDTSGNPVTINAGYSQVGTVYPDEQTLRLTYYDTAGNVTSCTSGFASAEKTYNEAGKQTGQAYFDAGGNPAPVGVYKYVRIDFNYADDGKLTKIYRDINGNIVKEEEAE